MSILKRNLWIWPVLLYIFIFEIPAKAQDSTTKKPQLLVLPVIANSVETSWSFGGVMSFTYSLKPGDTTIRTSNLQGLSLYTLKKQFLAVLDGAIYFPGEKYIVSHQLSYSSFPDKFWGLGNKTPNSNEEAYEFKQVYLRLHGQKLIGNRLFIGLLYEFQQLINIDYIKNGLFDQEKVLGRDGYRVSGLGLSLTYDTRNNAFAPDKGEMLQAFFNHFEPILGSSYEYTNYVIDLRKYIKLPKEQVLAGQFFGFFTTGDVPFRSLASLGGAGSMRGFYSGRFKDKNMLVLQAEYRVPLFWRIGAVAFSGVGDVGRNFNDFSLSNIKVSYGGGLRIALKKSEKLNLRVDYGFGNNRLARGFYLQLAEAF
jgi:outer membrane protein assembly factor BamA